MATLAFYQDQDLIPLTVSPLRFAWGWPAATIIINNDAPTGGETLYMGFNPSSLSGALLPGEQIKFSGSGSLEIWLWSNSTIKYRISVYSI